MTQFTVYRNKNPRSRTTFPFLVNVQSDLLDELQTRVVIPLTRAAALTRKPVSNLMPSVQFEGETIYFCCEGCATKFLAQHEHALAAE